MEKLCWRCKEVKDIEKFHKNKTKKDGHSTLCASCWTAYTSEYRKKRWRENPEVRAKDVLDQRRRRAQNPELFKEYSRRDCAKKKIRRQIDPDFKEREWAGVIRRLYEISSEEYYLLLSTQSNGCALCFKPVSCQTGRNKKFAIDHDHTHQHKTKTVACRECIRGLLCSSCNRRLLPVLEENGHLQSDFVKQYLRNRPFQNMSIKAL
jgi:hypothetical protein